MKTQKYNRNWEVFDERPIDCHNNDEQEDLKIAYSMCRQSCFLDSGDIMGGKQIDAEVASILEHRRHQMTNRIAEILDPSYKDLQRAHATVFKDFSDLFRCIHYNSRDLKICTIFPPSGQVSVFQKAFTREERILSNYLIRMVGYESPKPETFNSLFLILNRINLQIPLDKSDPHANIYRRLRAHFLASTGEALFGIGMGIDTDQRLADIIQNTFKRVKLEQIKKELRMQKWRIAPGPNFGLPITAISLATVFVGLRIRSPVCFLQRFINTIEQQFGCSVLQYLTEREL